MSESDSDCEIVYVITPPKRTRLSFTYKPRKKRCVSPDSSIQRAHMWIEPQPGVSIEPVDSPPHPEPVDLFPREPESTPPVLDFETPTEMDTAPQPDDEMIRLCHEETAVADRLLQEELNRPSSYSAPSDSEENRELSVDEGLPSSDEESLPAFEKKWDYDDRPSPVAPPPSPADYSLDWLPKKMVRDSDITRRYSVDVPIDRELVRPWKYRLQCATCMHDFASDDLIFNHNNGCDMHFCETCMKEKGKKRRSLFCPLCMKYVTTKVPKVEWISVDRLHEES